MRIYLAAPFDHIATMRTVRDRLQKAGHEITSRWLDLEGDALAKEEILNSLRTHPAMAQQEAITDLQDIQACDLLICWSDIFGTSCSWGGRHVEFGYALGLGKRIAVVGEPENLFQVLPEVTHYASLPDMLDALEAQDTDPGMVLSAHDADLY